MYSNLKYRNLENLQYWTVKLASFHGTMRHFDSYKSQACVQKWHEQFGHLTATHAQGLWQRRNTQKSNAHEVAGKNLIQYIQLQYHSGTQEKFHCWSRTVEVQLPVTECCSRLSWSTSASNPWKPPNLRNETNCYHFTGVIILPTQTMHYTFREIPQNNHTSALFDSPKKWVT